MASRLFTRGAIGHLYNEIDILTCTFVIGASGAVTFGDTQKAQSKGVSGVVKSDTGRYTITLANPYFYLHNYIISFEKSDSVATAIAGLVRSTDVKTAKTVVISTMGVADTEANPAEGTIVRVTLILQNSMQ